jgi:AcrR family transcriptional regulator
MTPQTQTGLRDTIVSVSGDLFVKQGYDATSIKQIADAAGCTTAALYYYFEGGKEAILKAVLFSHLPDVGLVMDTCADADSLADMLHCIGLTVCEGGSEMVEKGRWVLAEYPNLGENERQLMHEKVITIHGHLASMVGRFVTDPEEAEMIAWLHLSATFGFGQMFGSMGLESSVDMPLDRFSRALARLLGQGC